MSSSPQGRSERPTELVVGDPLVGWRTWRLSRRHGQLVLLSTAIHSRWPRRRRMIAHCAGQRLRVLEVDSIGRPKRTSNAPMFRDVTGDWGKNGVPHTSPVIDPPQGGCQSTHPCGIYALRDPVEPFRNPWAASKYPVEGHVLLWGVVIPYEKGWRAQYAYPRDLTLHRGPNHGDDLELLALELEEAYGVPVTLGVQP